MVEIIHDPTRGWLLLTEKWPIAPTQHSTGEYDTVEVSDYRIAINHCLSTAIEIDEKDEDALLELVDPTGDNFQNSHPYSVDAEFEVKMQFRRTRKGLEGLDDSSGYFVWLNCNDSNRDTAGGRFEYRQIARLVKAKGWSVTNQQLVDYANKKTEFQETESQDELWEELIKDYFHDINPLSSTQSKFKSKFRIERI